MIAAPIRDQETMPASFNPSAAGKHCGLHDIREAQLMDPNWKAQPMRPWDEVYEELCRGVGLAYGLSDIREA